jgi:hypothetical protein
MHIDVAALARAPCAEVTPRCIGGLVKLRSACGQATPLHPLAAQLRSLGFVILPTSPYYSCHRPRKTCRRACRTRSMFMRANLSLMASGLRASNSFCPGKRQSSSLPPLLCQEIPVLVLASIATTRAC